MNAQLINPIRLLALLREAAQERAASGLSNLVGRLRARLEEHRRYWVTVQELEMLTDRDLADIGLTRSDIRRRASRAVGL